MVGKPIRELRTRSVRATGLALALLAATPAPAQAYIDPGSGALVLQALLAGIFGALVLARKTLRELAARVFGVRRGRSDEGVRSAATQGDG